VDPIVLSSLVVLDLQTIVSREIEPIQPAVVTVGSIHGGTKSNIIPDEVRLEMTVRSFKDEVQRHLIAAIERIANAEAAAGAAPAPPTVTVAPSAAHATVNDPALVRRLVPALASVLGSDRVVEATPVMGAENFSEYGRAGVPAVFFFVGAVEPKAYAEAHAAGRALPALHSSRFAPDRERTIRAAVATLVTSALELLGRR
jgi:hippurate hydrolase